MSDIIGWIFSILFIVFLVYISVYNISALFNAIENFGKKRTKNIEYCINYCYGTCIEAPTEEDLKHLDDLLEKLKAQLDDQQESE